MVSSAVVMNVKSEKTVRFKTSKGNIMSLVREVYLRSDIPCHSTLCGKNCLFEEGIPILSGDLEHYILPDGPIAANYLELFELSEIRGVIFTLSTINYIQQMCGRRLYSRLKSCLADPGQGCILFDNEFHQDCFHRQMEQESFHEYTTRLNCEAAGWYRRHLSNTPIPILLLTNDMTRALALTKKVDFAGALVMTLDTYLSQYRPDLTAAAQLFESLTASLLASKEIKTTESNVTSHLPQEVLTAGLKSGQFFKGVIHVSKFNSVNEAHVILTEGANVKDATSLRGEVIVWGRQYRNRAVHGDMVCIELLPKNQWKSKSSHLHTADNNIEIAEAGEEGTNPTGRVVGIIQRNWRDYVCSLCPPPSGSTIPPPSAGDRNRVLVTPWDRRIPMIRITTSQAEHLMTQRFIVRIDSWSEDEISPHGHFVKALGTIGELETETQTILIEHNLANRPFTQVQLNELPVNTAEHPWCVCPAEVATRRDLRQSHLIFSIDPIGCQDVDDTLSVSRAEDGSVELGVHIADVTHFVPANSLLDMEARLRSTSVYMADRRFDMLPHTLSGDLCSLWSDVDRYAVSVIWKLTPNLEVSDVWYGRSVIRSRYKLHYELAQQIFEDAITTEDLIKTVPELTKLKEKDVGNLPSAIIELRTAIRELVRVASTIKERRMDQGGLELEGLEVQVQFSDPNRTQIEDLMPKQPLEMHETIAECMIFANHWVARRILTAFPENSCLRHHPPPRQDYFDEFMRCAQAKGFQVHTDSNKTLANSLNACVDPKDPEVNKILRTLCTQAMSNAMYFSTGSVPREEFAHYGLALNLYTHFTSPIRRYADVIVHRLLLAALKQFPTTQHSTALMTNSELAIQCHLMNERHRQAQYAQRVSTELFQCLFFRSKPETDPTRITDAVICNLRNNGFVVFLPRYGIRGAVYLKRKDGSIAWSTADGKIDWLPETSGLRIDKIGDTALHILQPATNKKQAYPLFGHVTVRVLVHESAAHGLALKLDLERWSADATGVASVMGLRDTNVVPAASEKKDISKSDIIQCVRSADDEKQRKRRKEAAGVDTDSDEDDGFNRLHATSSFYHFFLGVKEEASSQPSE